MIEIQHVTKIYPNGIKANQDISFTVNDGEVVALVGPNGSGKTTLMQQMLGVLRIGEGKILIDGKEDDLRNTAYIPQLPAIYPALTVKESLMVTTKYLGLDKEESGRRVNEVLERIGFVDRADQPTYTLSGGQKKLLSFGCMLVQKARNLVMDEVTSMIDVVTKDMIWKLIEEEKKKGCAILLSSHDTAEVNKLCTRLVVMKNGSVIFSGRPEEIQEEYCHCFIVTDHDDIVVDLLEGLCSFTRENTGFSIVTNSLDEMLVVLKKVSEVVHIRKMSMDHPSFYEGLLTLMKGE